MTHTSVFRECQMDAAGKRVSQHSRTIEWRESDEMNLWIWSDSIFTCQKKNVSKAFFMESLKSSNLTTDC